MEMIILGILGAILGAIGGFFVGKYRVYFLISKYNTIGDEYEKKRLGGEDNDINAIYKKNQQKQTSWIAIAVGVAFMVLGVFVFIKSVPGIESVSAAGSSVVLSVALVGMGGAAVWAGIANAVGKKQ